MVKLYVFEEGSTALKVQLQEAQAAAVCRIAWAEAHAALSRRAREVPQDGVVMEQAKATLALDWPHFVVMEIDQALVVLAGEYADAFALRGYDSIQLAAASEVARVSKASVFFACFDARLNKAARLLGLQTWS